MLTQPVPDTQAAALISQKPVLTRDLFDQLLPEFRARAFTISGIAHHDTIQNIRDLISEIPQGADWDETKKKIIAKMSPFIVTSDDPEERQAQTLRAQRQAELLIRHHTAQASAHTRHQQMEETNWLFPWRQYLSLGDGKVRASHRVLHKLCLPGDHPFWSGHTPPWDWGCSCQLVALGDDDIERIQEEEANLPDDQKTVLPDHLLKKLEQQNKLTRGPDADIDLRTPREKNGPDAYHFNPADLSLRPEDLRKRYDKATWTQFTKWAKTTPIPGQPDPRTVWQFLGGKPSKAPKPGKAKAPHIPITVTAPTGPVSIAQARKEMSRILRDIKKQIKAEGHEPARQALLAHLRTLAGNPDPLPPSPFTIETHGQTEQHRAIATAALEDLNRHLPAHLRTTLTGVTVKFPDNSNICHYEAFDKHILLGERPPSTLPAIAWHEAGHAIHLTDRGATPLHKKYIESINRHFVNRTKDDDSVNIWNDPDKIILGKRDKFVRHQGDDTVYAGREYPDWLSHSGINGIELPSVYLQCIADPEMFQRVMEQDPETLGIVLSIFAARPKPPRTKKTK